MRPKPLLAVVDDFSHSTSNEGLQPHQKGTQPARARIFPERLVRALIKYTFPESLWIEPYAGGLPAPRWHPSVVCRSIKVSAIVFRFVFSIFGPSLLRRQLWRNVRSSHQHHVRAHHSRKLSNRALEWLFGCPLNCHQCRVIAIRDEGMGQHQKKT